MATDPFFPNDSNDSNLQAPRDGEVLHRPQSEPSSMEGVKTGHDPDHYVHLANGAVIAGCAGGTHYDDPERGLVPIVSVYRKA